MNRKQAIVTVVVVVLCGIAMFRLLPGSDSIVSYESPTRMVYGTFARVVAVAEDNDTAEKCVEAAFEQFELVDDLMNDYREDSQISKVNRLAATTDVNVSEHLFKVLEKSVEFSRITNGAFDITVGPLIELMAKAKKEGKVPDEEKIAIARSKVGFEKLKLNKPQMSVGFAVEGMKLDLGGIAKGYAIDLAVEAMKKQGALGGMVDIGGDIRCFGKPPRGKSQWVIGLQNPKNADTETPGKELLLTLNLTDAAIATSGDYRRFVLIEGKKYSHIIDADTGLSSGKLSSVTIIAPNATDADALATAVSVMGAEKGLALIETIPRTEAIVLSPGPEYKRTQTSGAKKYLNPDL